MIGIKQKDDRLLDYLQVWKTRGELLRDTQIPWTTLYDSLARLLGSGKVKKRTRKDGKPGRPFVEWKRVTPVIDDY